MSKTKLPRGIRWRGDKLLVDVSIGGVRRTATCDTAEEAIVEQAKLRAAIKSGRPAERAAGTGPCWTVGQAWDHTYRTVWSGSKSDAEMVKMRAHVVGHFGQDTRLDTIDTAALDRWTDELRAKGNSNGTINRKMAALSKVMTEATRRPDSGFVTKPYFRRQKEAQGRIRQVSEQEELALLATLRQWGWEDVVDAVIVLLDTGMRTGELWRIEERDVTFSVRPAVSIWQTKADLPRTIPLTKRAAAVLDRRRQRAGWQGQRLLFPFDNRWMLYHWDRVKEHLHLDGDEQFVPHILRHTCACRLVQRGVPILVVKDWLGHRNIQTTMRYARSAPQNLADAVAALEQRDTPAISVVPGTATG